MYKKHSKIYFTLSELLEEERKKGDKEGEEGSDRESERARDHV